MNFKVFLENNVVYLSCECIAGISFKIVATWVEYALLPVICAFLGISRDNYAYFSRNEYLLPHRCLT